MAELTITIEDHDLAALQRHAQRHGVTVEQLIRACVTQLVDVSDDEFVELIKEILDKNAELYRRLAMTSSAQQTFTLDALLAQVTDENTHRSVAVDGPLGNEVA